MEKKIKGTCIVLGNNVDTDQIYPGCYLELTDPKKIGTHCLAGVDESIAAAFPKGGIIAAGTNFGCGSSREHAPISLVNMGAGVILAESFARIFFRNAINLGLPCIVCKDIGKNLKPGQTAEVDILAGTVTIEETGKTYPCEKLGEQAMKILEAGGIKPLMALRLKK